MNGSEIMSNVHSTSAQVLAVWLVALLAVVLIGIVTAALLRWRRAEHRVGALEREVAVYCEASTRVAQTLEEMLLARVRPGEVVHTSRRYLINQARQRLDQGEPLPRVARALGLSFDEVRLLERARDRGVSNAPRPAA